MTTEIRHVISYLGPDQVTEGFYTFDGVTLTMMGSDDKGNWSPMILDEEPVSEKVAPEQVEAVAKKLTRRIRKALRGETVEGFGRALNYEREVFA